MPTASSQHGVEEKQSEAGHPHTKTLKLAIPATPLHPKPAMSAPLSHSLAPAKGFIGSNRGEAASHIASKIPAPTPPEDRAGSACAPPCEKGAAAYCIPASLPIPVLPTVPAGTANRCWQKL